MWPHRQQPTRLPCPQDSPGKNTVVGCHFLLILAIIGPVFWLSYLTIKFYLNWHIYLNSALWTLRETSSAQCSSSVLSDSLWCHGFQQARLPCPSPAPRACLNSWPLSWWCHSTISSSVIPFSSCLRSFPASGSFQRSQLFSFGGQSIGVSALASVLPLNTQEWSPLEWTGWISLQSKGHSRIFSNTTVQKHQLFGAQLSL